jgi:undecaprenyl-diphosphatase
MTAIAAFIVFMVIGRLMSGVHWITDIIGGALFSAGIVLIYLAISNIATKNSEII